MESQVLFCVCHSTTNLRNVPSSPSSRAVKISLKRVDGSPFQILCMNPQDHTLSFRNVPSSMIVASMVPASLISASLLSITMVDLTTGIFFELCSRHTEWLELSLRHAAFLVFGTLVHTQCQPEPQWTSSVLALACRRAHLPRCLHCKKYLAKIVVQILQQRKG